MSEQLTAKVKDLPREPGAYMFRDSKGRVIYVGKAKSLKERVSTYFQSSISLEPKTKVMVTKVADLDFIKTATELEALILEAELIKKHKPKYNIIHKDDKSHLYIVIRSELLNVQGEQKRLPKVMTARKTDLRKDDIKFGPFTNSRTTKQILRTLRKIFPFRDCSPSKFFRYQRRKKPCLYGHLGLCMAPCLADTDLEKTQKEINRLKQFLQGKSSRVIKDYEKLMRTASSNKDYEQAASYRDILKKFEYIRTSFRAADKYIENPNLLDDLAQKAIDQLADEIPVLSEPPLKIECFDISDISGKEAVGSMVVSRQGQLEKSEYKKFKIRTKDEPDDVHMMKEVLRRRFKRGTDEGEKNKDWGLPDLIVLDGGKGHVSMGLEELKKYKVDIPLIGLAKRDETIVYKSSGKFEQLDLPDSSEGLRLLLRLRDEAHRFAQSYHHHLRLKKIKV